MGGLHARVVSAERFQSVAPELLVGEDPEFGAYIMALARDGKRTPAGRAD
jgi:hypothetical protein